jgi:adenosylhomocysteinase
VTVCASHFAATEDDVAAHLTRDHAIPTFAIQGAGADLAEQHLDAALEHRPNLILDDGAILTAHIELKRSELLPEMVGGVEQSAAGISRLRSLGKDGMTPFPILATTDSRTIRLIENRHGSGQVTLDNIIHSANILLAGQTVVIAGYGWAGRGIAHRARGLGAQVLITEIDPVKALEAVLDGFHVTSMHEAAETGDIFITATGSKGIITRDHFSKMKNNAILYNAGHSNVEIDIEGLARLASSHRVAGELCGEFRMTDGRRLYLIGEGRRILTGQPTTILDMNCAATALAAEFLTRSLSHIEKRLYSLPEEIDRTIARLKLESMDAKLERQSSDQERYIATGIE